MSSTCGLLVFSQIESWKTPGRIRYPFVTKLNRHIRSKNIIIIVFFFFFFLFVNIINEISQSCPNRNVFFSKHFIQN